MTLTKDNVDEAADVLCVNRRAQEHPSIDIAQFNQSGRAAAFGEYDRDEIERRATDVSDSKFV